VERLLVPAEGSGELLERTELVNSSGFGLEGCATECPELGASVLGGIDKHERGQSSWYPGAEVESDEGLREGIRFGGRISDDEKGSS
jgi:hypothetical protein